MPRYPRSWVGSMERQQRMSMPYQHVHALPALVVSTVIAPEGGVLGVRVVLEGRAGAVVLLVRSQNVAGALADAFRGIAKYGAQVQG